MAELTCDPPDSLLGLLQRGRGDGFRWLLREPSTRAHELLLACLRCEPRADVYEDSRGDYYGLLIQRTQLDLSALDGLVHDELLTGGELVVDVVGALAKRGERRAIDWLRAQLAEGKSWGRAFGELVNAGPRLLVGVEFILDKRFPNDDELFKAVELEIVSAPEPWKVGIDPASRLGRALSHAVEAARRRQEGHLAEYSQMATEDLIAIATTGSMRDIVTALSERVADAPMLVEAAASGHYSRRSACIEALAKMKDARLIVPAESLLGDPDSTRLAQINVAYALLDLPPGMILEKARTWFVSPVAGLRYAGEVVLSLRASAAEAPLLAAELLPAHESGDYDRLDNLLEAVNNAKGGSPAPVLRRIYRETACSTVRAESVEIMARDDGAFTETLSVECLWDCEDRARAAGAERAPLEAKGVRERLAEIEADRHEAWTVHSAIAAR